MIVTERHLGDVFEIDTEAGGHQVPTPIAVPYILAHSTT